MKRNQLPEIEPKGGAARLSSRLNWLRAGVLGANDGIVSVAALVVGVAGAQANNAAIVAAGLAALIGGAISMALGEYVSVSSQSDSQKSLIRKESAELKALPQEELDELTTAYQEKGLSESTAKLVAQELTAKNALRAHLETEFGITEESVVSPWAAAGASALAFTIGGILPFLAIVLPPTAVRVPVTFVVVLLALVATGTISARLGNAPVLRPTLRVVIGGTLALAATYGIGLLLGVSGA
jgi:VIT1/CCC1 family predicted Fe2+/Mn2+ transporter